MAVVVAMVDVDVELSGQAARLVALEHAVTIEAAAASADGTYNGERVLLVAKGFEAYLNPQPDYIEVVFDGPPEAEAGRFVEVEGPDGASINAGEWVDRGDGFWALRISRA